MKSFSAFIIALNEADRIGATIESVKGLADEIIVVDSGSTDGTQEVAAKLGAKVLFNPWAGYGPQKRFAEDQCRHDWLLNLDADEVLSPELREEIRALEPACAAYALHIREILPGQSEPSLFAHQLSPVRLYDRRFGRYAESPVHDRVQMNGGQAGALKAPVWHYCSRGVGHSIEKLNRYSAMQAKDMVARKGKPALLGLKLVVIFPLAFAKSYILRLNCLQGMAGFINAVTYAYGRFTRLAKVWELTKKGTGD